jgi:chromosome segregation ATPase
MESGKQPIDPSLALINDEILSTQVRLMELYVKQAQATAATEAARTQERLQAELAELQAELKQKNLALEKHKALSHRADRREADLRARLLPGQRLLEARETDLGTTDALRQRIAQLESTIQKAQLTTEIEAARARETWQAELAAVKGELERKESPLPVVQPSLDEVEGTLGAEILDLRSQLATKVELLEHRTAELQNARTQIALLQQRVQQLELTGAQTEEATSEGTRIRKTLQAEVVALRTAFEQKDLALRRNHTAAAELERRLNLQLRGLQSQVAEKQVLLETRNQEIDKLTAWINDLQEQIDCLELAKKQTVEQAQSAAKALQDGLRAQLQELEATASEKADLLHNRAAELESAQAEIALLRARMTQLELSGAQTEAARNEAERIRGTLQNELSELQQKDRSFAQKEAEFRASGERFHAQLSDLQNQLAEKQQLLDVKEGYLGDAARQIAGLEKSVAQLESLHAEVQAAAANEVDRVRREFQSERVALQTSLREKELALQERQTAIAELEANLTGQIQDFKNALIENQELLETRDQELQNVGSDAAVLRERIAQLESAARQAEQSAAAEASRIRAELQATLATLEAQLKDKEHQLAQSQAGARESEDQLQIQLRNLQIQVAEKQLLLETRSIEMSSLQDQLSVASERLTQLESASQQAIAAAARNAEIAQQRFDAELAARQEELRSMERAVVDYRTQASALQQAFDVQLRDVQSKLAEKQGLLETRSQEIDELTARTHDLQEQIVRLGLANKQTIEDAHSAARTLQDGLRARIQALEATIAEKADLLQNRTAELEHTQAETALLQERMTQLELSGTQTEAARNEAERVRQTVQNELANLHRALAQKDASLAQGEAEFKESSERLNTQLNELKNQLAEKNDALETQKHELLSARSEIAALADRMQELEHAKTIGEKSAALETERLKEQFQTELADLRADLAQRQLALEEEQTSAQLSGAKLKDDLHRLDAQLTEKQKLLDRSERQLQEDRLEITVLREELARSEFARRQTEMLAATQAEQIREQVKLEIGAMDAQLGEKETTLKSLTDRQRELELRVDDLRQQLSHKESLIESRHTEIADLRTQAGDLLAQINHLERAHGEALEQQRVTAGQLEQKLRGQVHELQNQLTEKLALLETRNEEVQALECKVTELVDRIDQSAVALEQERATAVSEMEQIRRQSEAELTARQAEVERKVGELQDREAALYAAEQNFKVEIDALRTEVAEKRYLLENRNEQLLRVKMEMDELQDRIAYLELAARQADQESIHKNEPAQEQSRPETERLWQELSHKERMLEQRQTAVNDLEQGLQAQINSLRSELGDKQAMLENPSKEFLIGDPTLTESQKEKLSRLEQLVETIKADNEQTLISPHNRKWRFSLGRKRRWKF